MVERNQCMLILTIVIVYAAFTCSDNSIPQSSVNASNEEPVSSDTQGSVGGANDGGENDENESDVGKEKKEEKEEVPSTVTEEEMMIDNSTGDKEVELVTTETEETMPLDNSLEPEMKEKGKYNESTEERKEEEEEGGIEKREGNIETVESTNETEGDEQGENDSMASLGQDKDTSSGQDDVTNSSSDDHASSINDTESSEPDDIVTFEEFKNRASQELNQPIKQPQAALLKPLGVAIVPRLSGLLRQMGAQLPAEGIIHKGNSNNFASYECGAKVVATNPEAKNSHAILTGNKDEYMLNPCSADIWFVIELCELVSVNKFEIGSFELFSSIPESFAVFTSESYPTSNWESISSFQMRNERGVQEFPLADTVYAKYIKIVMLSHFGSEHYCPISVVSVYGTTMMEEYELSETQRTQGGGGKRDSGEDEGRITITDTDNTDSAVKPNGPEAHNPLLAATGAIISVIGKAVNGLMGKEEKERINIDGDDERQLAKSTEPDDLHQVSSDEAQSCIISVGRQLSKERDSQELSSDPPATGWSVDVPVTTEVSSVASTRVLETKERDDGPESSSSDTLLGPTDELSSLSSTSFITSSNSHSSDSEVPAPSASSSTFITPLDSSSTLSPSFKDTLTSSEEPLMTSSSSISVSLEQTSLKTFVPVHLTSTSIDAPSEGLDPMDSTPVVPLPIETQLNVQNISQDDSESDSRSIANNDTLLLNNGTDDNNNNYSTNGVLHNATNTRNVTNTGFNVSNTTDPVDEGNSVNFSSGSHREKSVFLRLSNRINNLEMNMSLFGSYLDQISSSLKRSKNRTDDMQKSLERRMSYLNTTIQSQVQVQLNMSLVSDLFVSVDHLTLLLMAGLHNEKNDTDKIEIVLCAVLGLGIIQTLLLVCIITVLLQSSRAQSSLSMSIQSIHSDLALIKERLREEGGEEEEGGEIRTRKKGGGERERGEEKQLITKSVSHESFENQRETVMTLDSSSLPSMSRAMTDNSIEWHTVSHAKKKRKHSMSYRKEEPPITQK